IAEIIISAAFAAIMMLIQSGSVAQILSGRDTGWNPQRRDDGSIPFKSIARRHRAHTVLGVITLFAAALISPSLIIWMSPTIAGLIFSIPLSWASGSLALGLGMRRIGLLRTPEETSPPAVVERANALAAELALTGGDHDDALQTIWADATLRAAHESFLAEAPRRRRGDVDVETAVAAAKLNDAQTLEDARAWLTARERLAVLGDRALIAMLARLPNAAAQPNAA
ncbi:MAG TPA: glucan biosynthesis glucosyltransferase H, partial [Roseiarcus sp.]